MTLTGGASARASFEGSAAPPSVSPTTVAPRTVRNEGRIGRAPKHVSCPPLRPAPWRHFKRFKPLPPKGAGKISWHPEKFLRVPSPAIPPFGAIQGGIRFCVMPANAMLTSNPPRVLVVDDEREMAEMLADGLCDRGYEAMAAASSEE